MFVYIIDVCIYMYVCMVDGGCMYVCTKSVCLSLELSLLPNFMAFVSPGILAKDSLL